MSRSLSNVPALEGLRAVSCLVVVVWHGVLTLIPDDPTADQRVFILPMAVTAREAVTVFICLSGLLLGRHWRDARRGRSYLHATKVYAQRRLTRLIPPYWAALTVVIACMLTFGLDRPGGTHWDTGLPLTWDRVVTNYAMVTDLALQVPLSHQLWTVPTELHLYLLGPLVVLLLPRRWVVLLFGAAVVVALVVLLPKYHAPYFPFAFVAAFWLGTQRQTRDHASLSEILRLCLPIGLVSGTLLVVAVASGTLGSSQLNYFAADALVTPLLCIWLAHADMGRSRDLLVRTCEARALQWVGHRSYSIYLIHAVALELLWRGAFRPIGTTDAPLAVVTFCLVGTVVSVLAGWALFVAVEQPSLRWTASMGRGRLTSR